MLVASTYHERYTAVTSHVGIVGSIPILRVQRLSNYVSMLHLPIMLEIVLMLMAAHCALNYAGIMCACLSLDTLTGAWKVTRRQGSSSW